MTKVLVLYYSSYGHIEKMADAIAEDHPGPPWTLLVRDEAGWLVGRLPVRKRPDPGFTNR